jgi:hypothetical protein
MLLSDNGLAESQKSLPAASQVYSSDRLSTSGS